MFRQCSVSLSPASGYKLHTVLDTRLASVYVASVNPTTLHLNKPSLDVEFDTPRDRDQKIQRNAACVCRDLSRFVFMFSSCGESTKTASVKFENQINKMIVSLEDDLHGATKQKETQTRKPVLVQTAMQRYVSDSTHTHTHRLSTATLKLGCSFTSLW